jgi:redox-sensitive bicupin YhaK (pirin superfamily)
MEIITYVRKGVITHRDSMGNEGETRAGDVQVMSAGDGVLHEEWNEQDEATELFQIWILPREGGGAPNWEAAQFPKGDRAGKLEVLASGRPGREALPIRADGELLAGTLNAGDEITYELEPGRFAYLVPATGAVTVNGVTVGTRDGAAITNEDQIVIKATEEAEVILVDTGAA